VKKALLNFINNSDEDEKKPVHQSVVKKMPSVKQSPAQPQI
jgi:hypothetical protein